LQPEYHHVLKPNAKTSYLQHPCNQSDGSIHVDQWFTLQLGSVLLAFEGLLSKTEPESNRLSTSGLTSDGLKVGTLLAAHWPVGLCPFLSSKVMERTARLVGCGLTRVFGRGEEEEDCRYTA